MATGVTFVNAPVAVATPSAAPDITSFTPRAAIVGTTVTITGLRLSGVTSVLFNGITSSSIVVVSATSVTATVPSGTTTGPVSVYSPQGNASGPYVFTLGDGGADAGSGTVTSVATGTGLSGGPITATGTVSLANTTVTAAAYTLMSGTVDAQGRFTAANNGTFSHVNAALATAGTNTVTFGSDVTLVLDAFGSSKTFGETNSYIRFNTTDGTTRVNGGPSGGLYFGIGEIAPYSLELTTPFGSALWKADTQMSWQPSTVDEFYIGRSTAHWHTIWSDWFSTKIGSQLTAASTITPVNGLHHVTGATTIDTIATTNLGKDTSSVVAANSLLTLIADGGTITWSAAGNIMTAGTITQNEAQVFVYVSADSKWYRVR